MIAVDSSVVIAAAAPWHDQHAIAREALGARPHLPGHCGLESYSALTRMPEPYRAPAVQVAEFLRRRFEGRVLNPAPATLAELPHVLAERAIVGGPCYDALVAATANDHRATLLTLDARAERTYRLMGAEFEVLI